MCWVGWRIALVVARKCDLNGICHFSNMMATRYTRYFTFTKVNPEEKDYRFLEEECERIDAFLGYSTELYPRRLLRGFIILRGPRTCSGGLYRNFPNFLVTAYHGDNPFNFDEANDVVRKHHPFESLRKVLFRY